MNKQIKLYNVIFPIWLIVFLPTYLWLVIIPANLAVDSLVTWLCAKKLGIQDRKGLLKHTWWRFWGLGFLADFVGGLWMFLGTFGPSLFYFGLLRHDQALEEYPPFLTAWDQTVGHISHNAFTNPWAFLWTLVGVAIAGACIYLFDKRALKKCTLLDQRQKHILALVMAIVTAPWLFFIPIYW